MTRAAVLVCLLLVPGSVVAQDVDVVEDEVEATGDAVESAVAEDGTEDSVAEDSAAEAPAAEAPAAEAPAAEAPAAEAPAAEHPTVEEPAAEAQAAAQSDAQGLDMPGGDEELGALPEPLEYEEEEGGPVRPGDGLVGPVLRHLMGARFAAWAELSITTGGPNPSQVTAFVPEFGLRYRIADALVADVSFGMLVADTLVFGQPEVGGVPVPFESRSVRAEPGNPVLRGLFAHSEADWQLEVGAGVAIPSASRAELGNDPDSLAARAASEAAYRASMSMRGWWSPWRFAPERVSIVVPARLVGEIEGVRLEGEAGLAVMIPVLGDRGVDPDVVLQLAGGASFAVVDELHLGARVRAVGGALGTTLPGAIASAEPWVRVDLAPFHATVRGVINLNGMDGLVGRRGPGFGAFVAVGGSD
ncbi:MAG: hypothetical protein AB8I08_06850 [Sandaracinaceae bacterium]